MSPELKKIKEAIEPWNLLNHPFYQSWMMGTLSRDELQNYAAKYYPFVLAFPRFVSTAHSLCENTQGRKMLFENLSEEEGAGFEFDHPELWLQFAEGVGQARAIVEGAELSPATKKLNEHYFSACRASFAEALGALVAYESQVPEIAAAKIGGLKKFYGITTPSAHTFFEVHQSADVEHSEDCAKLFGTLSVAEQEKTLQSAKNAAQALWDFLSEVYAKDAPAAA